MKNVIQFGIGPLGRQVLQYLHDRDGINVTGVVDLNPDLKGKDTGDIIGCESTGVLVSDSFQEAITNSKEQPEIAVLTTVSSITKLIEQVRTVAKAGLHIVSTCEELLYPWNQHPEEAAQIDEICKNYGIACLGTGVNPGFLMDYLPAAFTSVCRHVDSITVERVQDASSRRIPFQKKIGAGLTHEEFQLKKQDGSLRHVGLPESVDLIAAAMGWKLEKNLETLDPVLTKAQNDQGYKPIEKGMPAGVEQIGSGFVDGKEVIKLVFRAAVGIEQSYDRIIIKGQPNVTTKVEGGIHGDIATSAITVNAIRSVCNTTPGLKTMLDVPVPAYYSEG